MTASKAPLPASQVHEVTAVVVICPGCATQALDDDGTVLLYSDAAAARADLADHYGWRVTAIADGTEAFACAYCAAPADAKACALRGHASALSPAVLLADGTVLGEVRYCLECGTVLQGSDGEPLPAGPPPAAPTRITIYWDALAFPAGLDIAAAAAHLIARLDDFAIASCWDQSQSDPAARPDPRAAASAPADAQAARALMAAARALMRRQGLPAAVAATTGQAGEPPASQAATGKASPGGRRAGQPRPPAAIPVRR